MTPEEEKQKVETLLATLDGVDIEFVSFAQRLRLEEGRFNTVDLLVMAVINRAMSLCDGFSVLIKAQNFNAAGHLVRSHLDNYLRFSAVWLVTDRVVFADAILEGVKMKKLKDRDGNFLSDTHLYKSATDHTWMEDLYGSTSGFIHLSNRHILTTNLIAEAGQRISFHFGKKDKFVTDDYKIQGLEIMLRITDAIMGLLDKYCKEKEKAAEEETESPGKKNIPPPILDPMTLFSFLHLSQKYTLGVEHFLDEARHRYRITFPEFYITILQSGFRTPENRPIWVQDVRPRERIINHPLIQSMGEALESEGLVKTSI
jgi:hypothetical protein